MFDTYSYNTRTNCRFDVFTNTRNEGTKKLVAIEIWNVFSKNVSGFLFYLRKSLRHRVFQYLYFFRSQKYPKNKNILSTSLILRVIFSYFSLDSRNCTPFFKLFELHVSTRTYLLLLTIIIIIIIRYKQAKRPIFNSICDTRTEIQLNHQYSFCPSNSYTRTF